MNPRLSRDPLDTNLDPCRGNSPERTGIADGNSREGHGLEADGQRGCNVVGQVGVDKDAPLPEYQRSEEQSQEEPDQFLLWTLTNDALGPMGVGVVAVPDQQLLVGVSRALLEAMESLHEVLLQSHCRRFCKTTDINGVRKKCPISHWLE